VALPVTVAPSGGASGTPKGSVTFEDNYATPAATLGMALLQNGVDLLSVTFLAGTHSLSASYTGDSNFAAGTAR
jgi:hypothetical protein